MTTGENIGRYLEEHGIKQSYVAKRAKIPGGHLSQIVNGKRGVGLVLYYRICEALGVSMDEFLGDEVTKRAAGVKREDG